MRNLTGIRIFLLVVFIGNIFFLSTNFDNSFIIKENKDNHFNIQMNQGTEVSGFISTDTVWNISGSPYYITDNLIVEQGVKLLINPGVNVLFNGTYSLIIDGALNATGSIEDPIIFSSNATNPQKSDWGALHFRDTCLDSESSVKFCNISYSSNGILLESAYPTIENNIIYFNTNGITINESGFVEEGWIIINNNTIFKNMNGISFIDADSDYIVVTENSIYNNTNNGINIDGNITSHYFLIQRNIISNNTNNGIYVSGVKAGNDVYIRENKIRNNLNGINLYDFTWGSTIEIENNSIESNNNDGIYINELSDQDENTQHLIYFNDIIDNSNYAIECLWSIFIEVINATYNWWGSDNSSVIENQIYDYYDNFTLATVLYDPFLLGPKDWDRKAPEIIINSPSPSDAFGVNAPSFNITIYDESPINTTWYTIDNWVTNFTFSGLTGTINQTAWDNKGTELIILRFYANDSLGNLGHKDTLVWKDLVAPKITIISPTPYQLFGVDAPSFSLAIVEPNLQEKLYSINGRPNRTFIFFLGTKISQFEWNSAGNGTVTIIFYAIDKVGNTNSSEITVRKDAFIPNITIHTPLEDEIFSRTPPEFNISIIEEDLVSTWYTIEGDIIQYPITVLTGTIEQDAWNNAPEGDLWITFYAQDKAGNIGTETVSVVKYIPIQPAIPGYNVIFLVGLLSLVAIITCKKIKKSVS